MSGGGTKTYKTSAYSMGWANEEQPQTSEENQWVSELLHKARREVI